jgi:hypothetical protein
MPMRWRLLSAAAMFVALVVLALTLAHWGWQWFGPAPAKIAVATPADDYARRIIDARLFGAAAPSAPTAAAPASGDLRLLGVIAQRNGRGYALFRSTARGPMLVAAGQDVSTGVRLDAVRTDGVTLMEGGARRDMPLRAAVQASTPALAEKSRPVAVASNAKSSACAAPAGFTGPIVRLNAELLTGMMNTTDAWKALVEPGSGALVVRDQSGFASNLGFKNGDRVESANGVALAIPADIPAMVLQPLTRSQAVWLSGSRDGKPQHWLYLNAGACPG